MCRTLQPRLVCVVNRLSCMPVPRDFIALSVFFWSPFRVVFHG
jgi:hypothetical protein